MVKSLMMDLQTAIGCCDRRKNYMFTSGKWGCFQPVMDKLALLDQERQQQREQDIGCW